MWGDTMIGPDFLVPLAGLCIFGFLFFDLVYLAAVVNYSIQSTFNVKYIKAVAEMVAGKNQKYSSLDIAIKVRTYVMVNNVVEAHGYGFRPTVVSGEHSRSKTSAIIALVLLRECSPLTTVGM